MKSLVLTPSTSYVKSSTTTTTTAAAMNSGESSESQDSFYFPGCRRDANCHCEICLASINATLDLMPMSAQRSSLTKFSASKPTIPKTPVSFDSSVLSTPPPESISRKFMGFQEKVKRKKKKKRDLGFGFRLLRWVLGLSLILMAEYGFSWVVMDVLRPELSPEMVKNVAEKSWVFRDLNEKLEFLKNELQGLVEDEVLNCSSIDSVWEINQDGLMLNSGCILFKSGTEEVSVWGWPLQTAGLLTTEFSTRSFTVLSGRVTEWSDGKFRYTTRTTNSSWTQGKWSSSVVQLDPNTWVLEYKKSLITENSRLFSSAIEFLVLKLSRELKKMKSEFWVFSAFGSHYSDFAEDIFRVPT